MAENQSSNEKSPATSATTPGANADRSLTDAASVRDFLQARINPAVAIALDAKLCLAWPAASELGTTSVQVELSFELSQGQLTWLEGHEPTDATFWFRDAQDVGHLLSSSDSAYADFMQRFMATQLSSDGYLPWAFTLLSLFRGGPSLVTPS